MAFFIFLHKCVNLSNLQINTHRGIPFVTILSLADILANVGDVLAIHTHKWLHQILSVAIVTARKISLPFKATQRHNLSIYFFFLVPRSSLS